MQMTGIIMLSTSWNPNRKTRGSKSLYVCGSSSIATQAKGNVEPTARITWTFKRIWRFECVRVMLHGLQNRLEELVVAEQLSAPGGYVNDLMLLSEEHPTNIWNAFELLVHERVSERWGFTLRVHSLQFALESGVSTKFWSSVVGD